VLALQPCSLALGHIESSHHDKGLEIGFMASDFVSAIPAGVAFFFFRGLTRINHETAAMTAKPLIPRFACCMCTQ
jgi:cytochrome bd-type quinol oxidase subunit 2